MRSRRKRGDFRNYKLFQHTLFLNGITNGMRPRKIETSELFFICLLLIWFDFNKKRDSNRLRVNMYPNLNLIASLTINPWLKKKSSSCILRMFLAGKRMTLGKKRLNSNYSLTLTRLDVPFHWTAFVQLFHLIWCHRDQVNFDKMVCNVPFQ